MKLANKFTLWFIGIILLITPISMLNTFNGIRKRIDNSEIERLKTVNDEVSKQLSEGVAPDKYTQGRPIVITPLDTPIPEEKVNVLKQCYDAQNTDDECRITVTSYYAINNHFYKVSSYNYVTQSRQIFNGMLQTAIIKILITSLIVLATVRLVSKKILSPFNQTLRNIQQFSIRKKQPLILTATNTIEFKELNQFLKRMTDKAINEYGLVKEFSENASHELQTPLAILRSKLELLTETTIQSNQALLIVDMQNAIEKLSRINHSLLLLTKLENQEFEVTHEIDFSQHVRELLSVYEDRISIKGITIDPQIEGSVYLKMNAALADMLYDNLLSNAIRHNINNGNIFLTVNSAGISISNTGPAPFCPTEELFQRFKKSNQCNNSIGLGLSIVKRICELNNFNISYVYQNGLHTLKVIFPETALTKTTTMMAGKTSTSKLLQ
ncbi:HAMP domain-containing histidine kinase [Olivibacter sp. SDN3]|uniref:sensor histidine kinase n=1 Tax=Olivibacter sp. SDN3 TaxID=2764720 RepID=UPI00165160B0|nr:HAMP domain-containing sensor histidine kinase [Olivibacter sp. SDN3]QNL49197.1 HAMP domain-containing histidine kinase [Olivibacter sp. SDN3]